MLSSLGLRSINKFSVPQPRKVFTRHFSRTSFQLSTPSEFSQKIKEGPSLRDFIHQDEESKIPSDVLKENLIPYINHNNFGEGRNVYIETYGCQMNVSDQEIILSIMKKAGYNQTDQLNNADIVFLNTCAIREKAEQKIWDRLTELKAIKKNKKKDLMVGVLGCMAERLKTKLVEADKKVDLVVGPDAYRDLPRLVAQVGEVGEPAVNVLLSMDETYADINPVRTSQNGVSAYVSIMRGCNNMCSYCIVPFTRGRERSRDVKSIEEEVRTLNEQVMYPRALPIIKGFKEVILLGQNVNSYCDETSGDVANVMSKGFTSINKKQRVGVQFTELLDRVSQIAPEIRFRFTSPHPKDFPDDLIDLIASRPNLCKSLHIPAQSGSSAVLDRMRRGYTREAYLDLIERIKNKIPDVAFSSDFISGFCGETEEEHRETVDLMDRVKYDQAFMFAYSLREKTHAHRHYKDDVAPGDKQKRLVEVINMFNKHVLDRNKQEVNKRHLVLVEGKSKKSDKDLSGRTDTNKVVSFPDIEVPPSMANMGGQKVSLKPGDFVAVTITDGFSHSLRGTPIAKSSIAEFDQYKK